MKITLLITFLVFSTTLSANIGIDNKVINSLVSPSPYAGSILPESVTTPTNNNITKTTYTTTTPNVNSLLNQNDHEAITQTTNSTQTFLNTTNYDEISLINPIKITRGCNTISVNLEDVFTVIAEAFKDAIKFLPAHYLNNTLGFPDPKNPKAVFEYIYDTTTTLICQGQAGIVQLFDTAIQGPMISLKNTSSTKTDADEDQTVDTQLYGCPGKKKDEQDGKSKRGESQTADEKSEAEIKQKFIAGQDKKFTECKEDLNLHKSFIFQKIAQINLLSDKNLKTTASTCEALERYDDKKFTKLWDYQDRHQTKVAKMDLFFVASESQQKTAGENIFIDNGILTTGIRIKDPDSNQPPELTVDRNAINEDIIHVPGNLLRFSGKDAVDISASIYTIGIRYANRISDCLEDTSGTNVFCTALKTTPGFLIDLPSSDHLSNKLQHKLNFCRVNLFNSDDDDFLKGTIGIYSSLHSEYSNPSVSDMKNAIELIILNDYCSSKYLLELKDLEFKMNQKLAEIESSTIGLTEAKLAKAYTSWVDRELYINTPIKTGFNTQVFKICAKSKLQQKYLVAEESSSAPSLALLKEYPFEKLIDLEPELKYGTETAIDKIDALEEFHVYDLEMFCNKTLMLPNSSCKKEEIKCAIDWSKVDGRTDNLQEDGSNDPDKGDFDEYVKKKNKERSISPPTHKTFEEMDIESMKGLANELIYVNDELSNKATDLIIRQIKLTYTEILTRLRP